MANNPPSAPPSLSGEDARLIRNVRMLIAGATNQGASFASIRLNSDDAQRLCELAARSEPVTEPDAATHALDRLAATYSRMSPHVNKTEVNQLMRDNLSDDVALVRKVLALASRVPSLSTSGAAEPNDDAALLDELDRCVAMCDEVVFDDHGKDGPFNVRVIGAGDVFGEGDGVRAALRESLNGYNLAMKLLAESGIMPADWKPLASRPAPSLEPTSDSKPSIPSSAILGTGQLGWFLNVEHERKGITTLLVRADAVEVVPAPSPATEGR